MLEASFFLETVVEQIADRLGLPAIQIKRLNFYRDGDKTIDGSVLLPCLLEPVTKRLLDDATYEERQIAVNQFNQANRWRKRGMAVVPMRFGLAWRGSHHNCFIVIYHNGGTVAVAHGGVELGQGINTKVTTKK